MSFIVAKKYKDKIKIFSDNKFYVSPEDEQILTKEIGDKNYRDIRCLGVIKNVIVNKNICVCSAGVLEDFNVLLKDIDDNNLNDLRIICDIALRINKDKNNRTDFIICSITDNVIYEIKNNKIRSVDSTWVGVYDCFSKYQELRLSEEINEYCKSILSLLPTETQKDMLEETIDRESFARILKLNIDETVGEVMIECTSSGKEFLYQACFSATSSKPKTLEINNSLITFDDSVFDGGYTFYVDESNSDYKMYIYQINCTVCYCAHLKSENYNHLRLPKIIYDNEMQVK